MSDHDLPEGAGIFVVGPTIGLLMWGAAFLAVHALAGCAPAYQCKKFPSGWTLCKGNQAAMDANCNVQYNDDGTRTGMTQEVMGCYRRKAREIWVEDSCRGAKALPHELAHKDGISNPGKEGFNWDTFGTAGR